jgi:hypothetical protein
MGFTEYSIVCCVCCARGSRILKGFPLPLGDVILAKRSSGYKSFPLRHLKKLLFFKVTYLKKSFEKSARFGAV